MTSFLAPLLGGVLIGVAVSLMLLWNGRVTGISGIINGALHPKKNDTSWRVSFVAGLAFGGLVLRAMNPDFFTDLSGVSLSSTAVAGVIVGFGTIMGSGCTSGHGVCGISRLSPRSIVSTALFMLFGIITVAVIRHVLKVGAV